MAAPKCKACDKSAYPLESVVIDGTPFHKQCFKCKECNMVLALTNYAMIHGDAYCKPHFKQIFAEHGGQYDAFGSNPAHKQWEKVNYTPGMAINSKVVTTPSNNASTNKPVLADHGREASMMSILPREKSESGGNSPSVPNSVDTPTNPFGAVLSKSSLGASVSQMEIFKSKSESGVLEYFKSNGGLKALLEGPNPALLDAMNPDCRVAGKLIIAELLKELEAASLTK